MKKEMLGRRFGQLTVLREDSKEQCGAIKYMCLCDCGNTKVISGLKLRSGHTRSCGCLRTVPDSVRKQYRTMQVDGKQVREHRCIAERMLGRKLDCFEVVHHKDGDKMNNGPDNLEVMSRADHMSAHRAELR